MKFTRLLLIFLVVIVLVEICEAGKKKKKEGEEGEEGEMEKDKGSKKKKEKKEKKEKKSKGEEEPKEKKEKGKKDKGKKDKESKKDKKKDKKTSASTYNPEDIVDREYWNSDKLHREWTEEDNPLNNPRILEISHQLKDFVEENYKHMNWDSPLVFDVLDDLFDMQGQYLDMGMPIAYLMGDSTMSDPDSWGLLPVNTLVGALVDTKGGEDIPPILTSQCTIEKCSETTWQWVINEDKLLTQNDMAKAGQPGILESLMDGFLATFTQLSQTFSKRDTQEILCSRSKSITTTKLTVETELSMIEDETKDFLKEPERYGGGFAEKTLKKSFDMVRGKMLMKMIHGLCG